MREASLPETVILVPVKFLITEDVVIRISDTDHVVIELPGFYVIRCDFIVFREQSPCLYLPVRIQDPDVQFSCQFISKV